MKVFIVYVNKIIINDHNFYIHMIVLLRSKTFNGDLTFDIL